MFIQSMTQVRWLGRNNQSASLTFDLLVTSQDAVSLILDLKEILER